MLRWFLNWTLDRGYNTNSEFKTFKPSLKHTQARVIYLEKSELETLMTMRIPKEKSNLEYVRDIFVFSCFSGLRHSDVLNLRRSDIRGDSIEVTTVKTADSITIELNDITRMILDRYKQFTFPGNRALPPLTNQSMNRSLKVLCRMAGIDSEIRVTTYKGNERHDVVKKKWELIGTHTGRRTFIVMALSMGIPPVVVMKWTGHADFKSMKPYVDIVDSIKASSMQKFNDLIRNVQNGAIVGQQYKEHMNLSDVSDAIAVLTRFEQALSTGTL